MSSEVTLAQIAEALGVSTMTVSRVMNNRSNVREETREKILKKARSMGYTPNHVAKSLASNKTYTIGVVVPEIDHSFFPEVIRGIEEVTSRAKYHLFLSNTNEQFEREKDAVKKLRSKRVDGILISSSLRVEDFEFYRRILAGGTHIVFFDRCIDSIGTSCVSVNNRNSSRQITEHLIVSHGYKKIAYLGGYREVSIGHDRMEGYLEAMQKHDLPVIDKWIISNGFQEEEGRDAMRQLLTLSPDDQPEAIVAVNDTVAIGAYRVIKEEGMSVPEDFALVGFSDDVRAPLLETPLTTIHQPAYNVGRKAAEKLIRVIEDENEPAENIELLTSLRIRASCGCAET